MKTERLPNVPKQEPGDFYYHHLKLPYGNYNPATSEEFPFHPDPTIADLMDITSDSGDQVGFVILKQDNTVEIVDIVTGQHVRVSFGTSNKQTKTA
jgi:hypothetical protein